MRDALVRAASHLIEDPRDCPCSVDVGPRGEVILSIGGAHYGFLPGVARGMAAALVDAAAQAEHASRLG